MSKPPPAHCGSCRAEIYWAFPPEGSAGEKMPIDAGSAGSGGAEVWRDPPKQPGSAGVLRYRMLHKGERPAEGHFLGMVHWATCEHADRWRRR